ncbi:hypothetical protein [Streptomyces sp. NPDC004788]
MLISHRVEGDALRVTLHRNLDVTTRAAATLAIEVLVRAHKPRGLVLRIPSGEPTPATLSAVGRARRMCASLGIPLDLTGATPQAQRLFAANPA